MNNQDLVKRLLALVAGRYPDLSPESLKHSAEALYTAGNLLESAATVRCGLQISYADMCKDASFSAAKGSIDVVQDILADILSIVGVGVKKVESPKLRSRSQGYPNFFPNVAPEPVGLIWDDEFLHEKEDIVPYFMGMSPSEHFDCGIDEYEDEKIFRVVLTSGRRYDVTVSCRIGSSSLHTGGDRLYVAESIESVTYKEIMPNLFDRDKVLAHLLGLDKEEKALPLHDGGIYLQSVGDIVPYFKGVDSDFFEGSQDDGFVSPARCYCKIQGRLYEVVVEAEVGRNKHDQYYIADINKIRYREICDVEGEAEEIEGEDGLWMEGN